MIKNLSKYVWHNEEFILSENANLHIVSIVYSILYLFLKKKSCTMEKNNTFNL